jgi:2-alkyl-3-oxoalkanoate reductase
MKTIVVTGAAGLVGRALLRVARSRGFGTRALVRPGGTPLERGAADEVVAADVRDEAGVRSALAGCAAVVHLAGHVDQDEDELRSVIVDGTRNVLAACGGAGPKTVVFGSTTAVYGSGDLVDVEESRPRAPKGVYASAKAVAEDVVANVAAERGLTASILRPCDIYGKDDRRFGSLLLELAENGVVPLVRGGTILYDVVAASDVAEACVLSAARVGGGGERRPVEIFNITSGETLTVEVLADRLRSATGLPTRTIAVAKHENPPPSVPAWLLPLLSEHRSFSVRKAREVLGYAPRVVFPRALLDDA